MEFVVVVSDLHIGSTRGLCTPLAARDDGEHYQASEDQRWLWTNWLDMWRHIAGFATWCNTDITMVLNGDAVEIDDKRRSFQLVSQNPATILRLAENVLAPAIDVSKRMFFIRGTGAHGGKSGWAEEALASSLDHVVADGECQSWWRLMSCFDGVSLDITHHGHLGGRKWTRPNALNIIAAEAVMVGSKANLIIRSHRHLFADSYDNYPIRAIAIPSWQLETEYLYRIGINDRPEVGAIGILCDRGKYQVIKFRYQHPGRETWTIETEMKPRVEEPI